MYQIPIDDKKTLSELHSDTMNLIQKVRNTKRPLIVTQDGESAAVVLDISEYEALLEKIKLLEDITLAEKQIAEGKIHDHETARRKVLEKLQR